MQLWLASYLLFEFSRFKQCAGIKKTIKMLCFIYKMVEGAQDSNAVYKYKIQPFW